MRERKHSIDRRFDFARIDQLRDLRELRAVGSHEQIAIGASGLSSELELLARGDAKQEAHEAALADLRGSLRRRHPCDRHDAAAFLHHRERSIEGVRTHQIEHHVVLVEHLVEALLAIVDVARGSHLTQHRLGPLAAGRGDHRACAQREL